MQKYGVSVFNICEWPEGVNPFLFFQLHIYYYGDIWKDQTVAVQSVCHKTVSADTVEGTSLPKKTQKVPLGMMSF